MTVEEIVQISVDMGKLVGERLPELENETTTGTEAVITQFMQLQAVLTAEIVARLDKLIEIKEQEHG